MEAPFTTFPFRYGDESAEFTATETYIPEDPAEREYGQVFLALRLSEPAEFQGELARIIMENVRGSYYADPELDPYESFERALKIVNEKLAVYAERRGPDFFHELHVALAIVSGNMLHLTCAGSATVYLKRGPLVMNVSEGLTPESRTLDMRKTFFNIASGDIRPSDFILLATRDLLQTTTEHHVRAALQPQNHKAPRLMKAKLGIKEADAVVIMTGEQIETQTAPAPVGGGFAGLGGFGGAATKWTQKLRDVFSGPQAAEGGARGGAFQDLYAEQRGPSKLQNTLAILKANMRKSSETVMRKFTNKELTERDSRNAVVIAAVVLLLVLGGVFWGVSRYTTARAEKRVVTTLRTITDDRETAQTRAIYDKETAKVLLADALKRAQELETSTTKPQLREAISQEIVKIQEVVNRVDNIFANPDPKVAYDLAKERTPITPLGLVDGGGSLWAFDYNGLYKMDLDKVDRRKIEVAGLENVRAKFGTYLTQQKAVVLYTEDRKVIEYKDGNFALARVGDDKEWKPAIAVAEFSERPNLYLLDPAENQIWRYNRGRSAYDGPTSKILPGQSVKAGVSIAVDGNIYVLTSDGTVQKTYDIQRVPFEWENFTETSKITQPTQIVTSAAMKNLYVLEPATKRVVVTSKSGRYLAQYQLPNAGRLVSIAVREGEGKVYLLEDTGKIYEVALQATE